MSPELKTQSIHNLMAEVSGLQAALRLKDIEIARVKLELAHEKYNHASLQIAVADVALKAAQQRSRCPSS